MLHATTFLLRFTSRLLVFLLCGLCSFLLVGHAMRLAPGLSIARFAPTGGYPGVTVSLTGSGFTGVTGVTFNGTPAICWTVNSDTQITAVVPSGATTGAIFLTNATGSLPTSSSFSVAAIGQGRIVFQKLDNSATDANGNPRLQIYSMWPDGSGLTRLSNPATDSMEPACSPDGTRFAYVCRNAGETDFHLKVMRIDGHDEQNFPMAAGGDSYPSFSPDGQQIVFVSTRDGNQEIYRIQANGSGVVRLTNDPGADTHPIFAPEGLKILFSSNRGGSFDFYVMATDGTGVTPITSNDGNNDVGGFSPGGGSLVFTTDRDGNRELYRMDKGVTNLERLTNNLSRDTAPSYSPDGQSIVFASDRDGQYEIYRMGADGNTPAKLTTGADGEVANCPSWGVTPLPPVITGISPASGWPGTRVTLTGEHFFGATGGNFNDVSANFGTVDSDTQITTVVPPGAHSGPITLTTLGGTTVSQDAFIVAPSGRGTLTFCRRDNDGHSNIFSAPADGSAAPTKLTTVNTASYPVAASPDGASIAYVVYNDAVGTISIYTMQSDGSGATKISESPTLMPTSLAFSPDGRNLLCCLAPMFGGSTTYTIQLMQADGSNAQILATPLLPTIVNPTAGFSPDGHQILYTSRDSTPATTGIYQMEIDGGNGAHRLTDPTKDTWAPACSPDGHAIAFVQSDTSGYQQIFLMNADGTGQTQVTRGTGNSYTAPPVFSPDGTKLGYIADNRIFSFNLNGSGRTTLIKPPATCHDLWVTWAPDGVVVTPTITGFTPTSGVSGSAVTISGSGFTGALGVVFGKTQARFSVDDSDGQITTVIPPGAATAPISVITPNGRITATDDFTVLPSGPDQLVFASGCEGTPAIYAQGVGGVNPLRLTDLGSNNTQPAFSSDGTQLAFISDRNGVNEVYRMQADGNGQTRVTTLYSATTRGASFRPDGRQVICYTNDDGLATFRLDGTNSGQFPNAGIADTPVMSPDGHAIVYSVDGGGVCGIYLYQNGTETNLCLHAGLDSQPTFSPDGSQVAFVSQQDGNAEIYLINTDGSGLTRLTNHPAADTCPQFSGDGGRILFLSDRDGAGDVYAMNSDGSNVVRLTGDDTVRTSMTLYSQGGTPAPTLNAITPTHAPFGRTVTLTGQGFAQATAVFLHGQRMFFNLVDDSTISLFIPETAQTGALSVASLGGASSSQPFTVDRQLLGVALDADAHNVLLAGHDLHFVATPQGGIAPEYTFTVTLKDLDASGKASTQTIVPAATTYSGASEVTFTAADPGTYTISVKCREHGMTKPLFTKAVTAAVSSPAISGDQCLYRQSTERDHAGADSGGGDHPHRHAHRHRGRRALSIHRRPQTGLGRRDVHHRPGDVADDGYRRQYLRLVSDAARRLYAHRDRLGCQLQPVLQEDVELHRALADRHRHRRLHRLPAGLHTARAADRRAQSNGHGRHHADGDTAGDGDGRAVQVQRHAEAGLD